MLPLWKWPLTCLSVWLLWCHLLLITAAGFSARLSRRDKMRRDRGKGILWPIACCCWHCAAIARGMLHGVVVGTVMALPFGSGMSHPGFSSDFLCMLVGAKWFNNDSLWPTSPRRGLTGINKNRLFRATPSHNSLEHLQRRKNTHTHACTHTHAHTHTHTPHHTTPHHTHTHYKYMHYWWWVGRMRKKKTTNQYAKEKKWVFNSDF